MTTLQMNAQLQQNLAFIQKDEGMTQQLLRYTQRLVNKMKREETEYISKEEILRGIDEGLREVKLAREGKVETKTLQELIDEL